MFKLACVKDIMDERKKKEQGNNLVIDKTKYTQRSIDEEEKKRKMRKGHMWKEMRVRRRMKRAKAVAESRKSVVSHY